VKSAFPQTPEALAEHPFGRIPSMRCDTNGAAVLLNMKGTDALDHRVAMFARVTSERQARWRGVAGLLLYRIEVCARLSLWQR